MWNCAGCILFIRKPEKPETQNAQPKPQLASTFDKQGQGEMACNTLYYPKTLKSPESQTPISQSMKQSVRVRFMDNFYNPI